MTCSLSIGLGAVLSVFVIGAIAIFLLYSARKAALWIGAYLAASIPRDDLPAILGVTLPLMMLLVAGPTASAQERKFAFGPGDGFEWTVTLDAGTGSGIKDGQTVTDGLAPVLRIDTGNPAHVGHIAFTAGVEIHELRLDRFDLEQLFFSLTEGQYTAPSPGAPGPSGMPGAPS